MCFTIICVVFVACCRRGCRVFTTAQRPWQQQRSTAQRLVALALSAVSSNGYSPRHRPITRSLSCLVWPTPRATHTGRKRPWPRCRSDHNAPGKEAGQPRCAAAVQYGKQLTEPKTCSTPLLFMCLHFLRFVLLFSLFLLINSILFKLNSI